MAKIIKCNRECANWSDKLRDCTLGHDVFQSMLGVIYVEQCEDFEDIADTEVPDYMGGDDVDYNEDDYEDEPSYRKPKRYSMMEQKRPEERRPLTPKRDVPRPSARPTNRDIMNFAERAKQKLAEARRLQEERERAKRRSRDEDYDSDIDDGPDPLEDLRQTYEKRGISEGLSDLRQFMEDAKSGKIDPHKIEEEIASIARTPIKVNISEEEIEAEKERIRKQIGVSGINEAAKKKKPGTGK